MPKGVRRGQVGAEKRKAGRPKKAREETREEPTENLDADAQPISTAYCEGCGGALRHQTPRMKTVDGERYPVESWHSACIPLDKQTGNPLYSGKRK